MQPLRVLFAGTPDFAAIQLQALINNPLVEVIGVYSQPDRPTGRGKKLTPTPVKQLALAHRLSVVQPASLKDRAAQYALEQFKADLLIVVAYGMLLPREVLDSPRLGCINVHASLLPRWRGAAPIERAIEAGDQETGITIMQMDGGLDTGDMLYKTSIPIDESTTGDSLRASLAQQGVEALLTVLAQFQRQAITPEKQNNEHACYAKKLTKLESEIGWDQSAEQLARRIRAFNSSNVCYSQLGDTRIKLWEAQHCQGPQAEASHPGTIIAADKSGIRVRCGDGVLNLTRLQLPGGKALTAAELLNAHKKLFMPGQQFHSGTDKR